jgi:hypothetical protein
MQQGIPPLPSMSLETPSREAAPGLLRGLKLRAPGGQSGRRAPDPAQEEDHLFRAGSSRRWCLRAQRRWRPDLLQGSSRALPRGR